MSGAGPGQGRGSGKNPGGDPAGGGGAGRSVSARFHTPGGPRVPTRLAAGRVYSSAPRASISAPISTPLPAFFHSPDSSSSPGPRVPSRLQQMRRPRLEEGPVQHQPGSGGRRERESGEVPKPRWASGSAEAQGTPSPPASSLSHPVPTCQRPRALPLSPPLKLLKFATCSPSSRGGSTRGSRDSPPGCGRRCPVPGGSRRRRAAEANQEG